MGDKVYWYLSKRIHKNFEALSDDLVFEFVKEPYYQTSNDVSLRQAIRLARIKCEKEGDPWWLDYQLQRRLNAEILLNWDFLINTVWEIQLFKN